MREFIIQYLGIKPEDYDFIKINSKLMEDLLEAWSLELDKQNIGKFVQNTIPGKISVGTQTFGHLKAETVTGDSSVNIGYKEIKETKRWNIGSAAFDDFEDKNL